MPSPLLWSVSQLILFARVCSHVADFYAPSRLVQVTL